MPKQSRSTKKKWDTFVHNGVLFFHPYEQHNTPLIYDGKKITLSIVAEEMATLYARSIDPDKPKPSRFAKNFWKSWKSVLNDTSIKSLDQCDFSLIIKYLDKKKEERLNTPKDKKQKVTENKEVSMKRYKIALVDGVKQAIGSPLVEPTGLFMGRGSHPKSGTIKQRVTPEDVTINISKGVADPKIYYLSKEGNLVEMKGRSWGNVVHDNTLEWVASWTDNVSGKKKYVWLADTCNFKSDSDVKKFDIARKLKKKINDVRIETNRLINSDNIKESQLGTAIYIMDNLALRVGNEKGNDEADTVGLTSLRVEHIKLSSDHTITLDFLGKDTMRYFNTIKIDENVYSNLVKFTKEKDKSNQLFEKITSCDVNEFLQSMIKGLTAKSFRTFNASNTFQRKLKTIVKKYEGVENLSANDINDILKQVDHANIEVAKLCNHQKAVTKGSKNQIKKMKDKIEEVRKLKRNLQARKKRTKTIDNKIVKMNDKIKLMKSKISIKNELKNISLNTSKINYIDPRIFFSFSKKLNIPIEKFYSTT